MPIPVLRTIAVPRPVSEEAQIPCAVPVVVPDRDLSEPETSKLWGRDRAALTICETRRAAAVNASTSKETP